MGLTGVQAVIGRAATDAEFRKMLLDNPDEALAEFDLTDEEREALKNLDSEKLESFSQSLDERLTKGWSRFG